MIVEMAAGMETVYFKVQPAIAGDDVVHASQLKLLAPPSSLASPAAIVGAVTDPGGSQAAATVRSKVTEGETMVTPSAPTALTTMA